MNSKPNIKIFVSHRIDLNSVVVKNGIFVPVRCGAALDKKKSDIIGDDTGDNISLKKERYCECTVQYWAWKNVDADYYGLAHYRRYMSFSDKKYNEDIFGAVNYNRVEDSLEDFALTDEEQIRKKVSQYDLIVSAPSDLRKSNIKTIYEQYEKTPHLHIEDLKCAVSVLKELYPEYSEAADEYLNGSLLYPCNLFIMNKALYNEYCEWYFKILEETEKRIDISMYSEEGRRTIAHIGERILGIFFTYIRKTRPEVRTYIAQRSIIWCPERFIEPKPAFKEKCVPVVFACSDYFVPYASVALKSVIDNTSDNWNYDIIFLHTGISKRNQQLMNYMLGGKENLSLRFLNIQPIIANNKLIANNHVSVETFYRLSAHKVLKHYDKIVYLDSDIVVLNDVAELFKIDIGNNLIAATVDADHAGEYAGAIPNVQEYTDEVLKLKNPYKYFQAGVMVFNIKGMNKKFPKNEIMDWAEKREYMYVDQDVLNTLCEGKIYYVDMKWNVMTDCNGFRLGTIIKRAPKQIYDEHMEARKDPYIIHYAGNEKPWNSPLSDYSEYFWEYARKTPFYEAIVWRMSAFVESINRPIVPIENKSFMRKIADKLFPKGTRRRENVKRIYFKFKRK